MNILVDSVTQIVLHSGGEYTVKTNTAVNTLNDATWHNDNDLEVRQVPDGEISPVYEHGNFKHSGGKFTQVLPNGAQRDAAQSAIGKHFTGDVQRMKFSEVISTLNKLVPHGEGTRSAYEEECENYGVPPFALITEIVEQIGIVHRRDVDELELVGGTGWSPSL